MPLFLVIKTDLSEAYEFDDLPTANRFAAVLTAEVASAHTVPLGDPVAELLGLQEQGYHRAVPYGSKASTISPAVASHVLNHFGQGGSPASAHFQAFIGLVDGADGPEQNRLALAHPDYVAAVRLGQNPPSGIATLKSIAGVA